jgi:Fe-S-cluster containining protein
MLAMSAALESWYRDGLRFACTQCGNCCTGAPGYVFVTAEEVAKIAAFLDRPDDTLPSGELRRVGRRLSLTERANGDCVFLNLVDGKRICGIYPVRPLQCRTWPFWDSNLESRGAWRMASLNCPGMDRGPQRTYVQIERLRTARTWNEAEP